MSFHLKQEQVDLYGFIDLTGAIYNVPTGSITALPSDAWLIVNALLEGASLTKEAIFQRFREAYFDEDAIVLRDRFEQLIELLVNEHGLLKVAHS